jgi:hypothetical protein
MLTLLWIVHPHPHALWIACANIARAFLSSGLHLSASSFIDGAAAPQQRHCAIAYFNVPNGGAISAGAFLGGSIATLAEASSPGPYVVVFGLSAALRAATALGF